MEFTFDMGEDTAECIASEMMEDLSLSAEEADFIAAKIREEIGRISQVSRQREGLGRRQARLSEPQRLGTLSAASFSAGAPTSSTDPSHRAPSLCRPVVLLQEFVGSFELHGTGGSEGGEGSELGGLLPSELDPMQTEAVREAVVANAAAAAVVAVATAAAAANASSNADSNSSRGGTSYGAGGAVGRPPSIHDLVKAMREYHEARDEQQANRMAGGSYGDLAGGGGMPLAGGMHAPGGGGGFEPVSSLDASPIEVRLPNGHSLDPVLLAHVAATAATVAAQQLNEQLPSSGRGHGQHVFHVSSSSRDMEGVDLNLGHVYHLRHTHTKQPSPLQPQQQQQPASPAAHSAPNGPSSS